MTCTRLLPVVVTPYPTDEDHAPLTRIERRELFHARVISAREVETGDLILASFERGKSVYFNEPYRAEVGPYDRCCGCGVCCTVADEPGGVVVLSYGPGYCDPWLSEDLVLVIPWFHRRLTPKGSSEVGVGCEDA